MQLLRSKRNMIAQQMKISPENFRWYAAYHNEGHHPHVHMIAYSVDPNEAYLSPKGIEHIKSELAKEILQQDLISIYDEQTTRRDELRSVSKEMITDIVSQVSNGAYENPRISELLLELSRRLANASGRKVYGYLKAGTKAIVDSIAEELAADPRIAKLYDLWYEQREAVLHTYTDTMPPRIPLWQNKEFKFIRNAVIQEALRLHADMAHAQSEQAEVKAAPEYEPKPDSKPQTDRPDEQPHKDGTPPANSVDSENTASSPAPPPAYLNPHVFSSTVRLLYHASRMLQNQIQTDSAKQKPSAKLDRKEWQKIREKKEAQGMHMG